MHLLPAILRHAKAQNHAFYVPGHKGNTRSSYQLHRFLQELSISADLTELDGLDNLHSPDGVIAKAQQHASAVFSSAQTMFLVNGTTCGILAAVCAACSSDCTLLVSRASHGSVFNAAALSGCHLATIEPEVDMDAGVAHGTTAAAVAAALDGAAAAGAAMPPVGAVLITSPTYFGTCCDVRAIAEVCHGRGVLLLVDEAHGAHFGLHTALPPSAMHAGADVAVQSTHKTLDCLTQASMLHVGPCAPPGLAAAISRHLSVFQSTSPSYLLMASLELAAHSAADARTFDEPLRAAMHVRHAWQRCGGRTLCMAPAAPDGAASVVAYDPLRVTLLATGTGMSGFDLSDSLQRLQVIPEMATDNTVVLALGSGSTLEDAKGAELAFGRLWRDAVTLPAAADAKPARHAPPAPVAPDPAAVAVGCHVASPQASAWISGLQSCRRRGVCTADGADNKSGTAHAAHSNAGAAAGGAMARRRYKRGGGVKMVGVLRGALAAAVEEVAAAAAEGRRSGALVSVYPPGVPLVLYGEVVDAGALAALRAAVEAGARLAGCCADGSRLLVLQEGGAGGWLTQAAAQP